MPSRRVPAASLPRAPGRRRRARSGRGPARAELGSVDVDSFCLEPIPGRGLRRLAPAGQGVAQARDHLRLKLFGPAARRLSSRASSGPGRVSISSPSRRAISRSTLGDPAVQRQSDERVRIGLGDRDQARPDQGRDIVVGVVLGSRDEGLRQLHALAHRQPLQRRGQHQSHQARGIIPGERGELVRRSAGSSTSGPPRRL